MEERGRERKKGRKTGARENRYEDMMKRRQTKGLVEELIQKMTGGRIAEGEDTVAAGQCDL